MTTLPIRQQPCVDFTRWLPETSHPVLKSRACVCVRVYVSSTAHKSLWEQKYKSVKHAINLARQPQGSALRFTKRSAARVCHPAAKKKKDKARICANNRNERLQRRATPGECFMLTPGRLFSLPPPPPPVSQRSGPRFS